jgi:hypothetical protein
VYDTVPVVPGAIVKLAEEKVIFDVPIPEAKETVLSNTKENNVSIAADFTFIKQPKYISKPKNKKGCFGGFTLCKK